MNKKATDKLLTLYWFVIILLVAGGIFGMVYSFYSHPYDVREIEGKIMINQIADCLSAEGEMNPSLFEEEKFSQSFSEEFLKNCHINLETEEKLDKPQYYLQIDFYNSSNFDNSLFTISEGNLNLIAGCSIQEEKEYKREVECVEDNFFSFHNENLYLIKILTIIRKTEKNVK